MTGIVPTARAPLDDWLAYIERVHPQTIDMGLERVRQVRDAMGERRGLARPGPRHMRAPGAPEGRLRAASARS